MEFNNKEVVNWSFKLQYELESLSDVDFNKYMENRLIKYDGQLWTKDQINEKCKRKSSKNERKTGKNSKRSARKSQNH